MPRPKKQFNIDQYEKEQAPEPVKVEEPAEVVIADSNDPCVGCEFEKKKSQRFCGSCVNYK